MSTLLSEPTHLPDFSELDLGFDIVDSHHLLFGLEHVYYPWLTDKQEPNFLLGDYTAIRKNYLPEDYQIDSANLQVIKTVHVEAEVDRAQALKETRWLDQIIRSHPVHEAIVAHAWLHTADTPERLQEQAEFSTVRGIRSKPVTSPTAATKERVNGVSGSMQDPAWREGLGRLREYDLSWDCRVPFWHLQEAAEVCALYPDLAVVVEHTGLPWDRSEAGLAEWHKGLSALASLDNVTLKISELGLAGDPWNYEDNRRVVLQAIELFGFSRCMFASNFPVAGLRIGYHDQVAAIATMVRDCTPHERAQLFCDTATRFYRLTV